MAAYSYGSSSTSSDDTDMDDYDLHATVTFEGYKCKFMEKPLPCGSNKCKHGYYCRSCDACGMTVKGSVYHCANWDQDFDFHPQCVKLKTQICVGDVIFRLQKQGPSKCLWCRKRRLPG